jgi:SPP1 gp7 family putative phage head morphogenesis protein
MSLITNIRDKYIIEPVTKQLLSVFKQTQNAQPADVHTPNIFAVPIGFNTTNVDSNRRQVGFGSTVTYSTLRQLSIMHETTRAAINVRKRQITQLDWDIVELSPDSKKYSDSERATIKEVINHIGGEGVRFREIIDKFIEDVLVIDGLCFYKVKSYGNKLLNIIPIDSTTIKLRIDESGFTPKPPEIAYEQWVRGTKVAELTTDEMIYDCMNPRTNSPYGLSPVESLILTIDSSMRASLYNSSYLSDNNVPMGFLSMPEEWTVPQIKEYKEFFDAILASPKEQAKVFPIPGGTKYQATTKPKDFDFKDFFDYLDRKVCMLFDVTPQELGLSLQQYKENAEGQEKIGQRKGPKPLAHFLEEIFTDLINNDLGLPGLGLKFKGLDSKYNSADINVLVPRGVLGIDEVRADMGLAPLDVENFIVAGNTVIKLKDIASLPVGGIDTQNTLPDKKTEAVVPEKAKEKVPQEENAGVSMENKKAELAAWQTKAINDVKKKGKIYRTFRSSILSKHFIKRIQDKLSHAATTEQVKEVFKGIGDKNTILDAIEKSKEFKDFKRAAKDALLEQIKPFTKPATIDKITQAAKSIDEKYLPYVDDLLPEIDIQDYEDYVSYAAQTAADSTLLSLGLKGAFSITNDKFKQWVKDRENYLIDSVNETTKQYIVQTISDGKIEGLSNEEIASQISSEYDDISDTRADIIVRTEVGNASLDAADTIYDEQGFTQKVFRTSEDDMVCPVCEAMDGQTIDVGEDFGDDGDLQHPNCRCFTQAVTE